MQKLNEQIISDLKETVKRWNDFEETLKKYQLSTGKMPVASINELRYAGRQVTDCLYMILSDKSLDENKMLKKICVANQYFDNAVHDLFDVINFNVNKVHKQFLDHYGQNYTENNYTHQKEKLEKMNADIIASRKNRDKRKIIYDNLIENDIEFCCKFEKYLIKKIEEAEENNIKLGRLKVMKNILYNFLVALFFFVMGLLIY